MWVYIPIMICVAYECNCFLNGKMSIKGHFLLIVVCTKLVKVLLDRMITCKFKFQCHWKNTLNYYQVSGVLIYNMGNH